MIATIRPWTANRPIRICLGIEEKFDIKITSIEHCPLHLRSLMQPDTYKSICSLIARRHQPLRDLYVRARYLEGLNRKLDMHLGSPLNRHCCVAHVSRDSVLLHTDSPAWSSRLRFCTPQVLAILQDQCRLPNVKTIRIRVTPQMPTPLNTTHACRPTMSRATSSLLTNVAVATKNPALRRALLRLARHTTAQP